MNNLEKSRKQDKDYKKELRKKPECRELNRKMAQKWRWTYPEKHKNILLKRKYGITFEQYNEMLKKQKDKCAICLKDKTNFKISLAVDHNHQTGKIRGLLCIRCNHLLGNAFDNIKILKQSILYLKKYD